MKRGKKGPSMNVMLKQICIFMNKISPNWDGGMLYHSKPHIKDQKTKYCEIKVRSQLWPKKMKHILETYN